MRPSRVEYERERLRARAFSVPAHEVVRLAPAVPACTFLLSVTTDAIGRIGQHEVHRRQPRQRLSTIAVENLNAARIVVGLHGPPVAVTVGFVTGGSVCELRPTAGDRLLIKPPSSSDRRVAALRMVMSASRSVLAPETGRTNHHPPRQRPCRSLGVRNANTRRRPWHRTAQTRRYHSAPRPAGRLRNRHAGRLRDSRGRTSSGWSCAGPNARGSERCQDRLFEFVPRRQCVSWEASGNRLSRCDHGPLVQFPAFADAHVVVHHVMTMETRGPRPAVTLLENRKSAG